MSKETADALRQARALIDTPERWCKDAYARDAGGYIVDVSYIAVARRCPIGALKHIATKKFLRLGWLALKAAIPAGSIATAPEEMNDYSQTTHADIMALYDRAIAAEEADV